MTTMDCIKETVQSVGTVTIEQLLCYFRNAYDAGNLAYYIENLINSKELDYDKSLNVLTVRNSLSLKKEVIRRRVMAFWLVAQMGYDSIREIYPLKYPSQLLFVTQDDKIYDLSVCISGEEAAAAERVRSLRVVSGVEDSVEHIAIVPNRKVGAQVMQYGFDCYCIYTVDKVPQYYVE